MASNVLALTLAMAATLVTACGRNPYVTDPGFRPDIPVLTALPCDTAEVTLVGAYGAIVRENGISYFHNGIDFTTVDGGKFYSCADGVVSKVEINTGVGCPGTNYRIFIRISSRATIDYHFEIGGSVPEQRRRDNIFVSQGQRVTAGQHIANLINAGHCCHVHFWVIEEGSEVRCPLSYFTQAAAAELERLFDSPRVDKWPPYRTDLCQ